MFRFRWLLAALLPAVLFLFTSGPAHAQATATTTVSRQVNGRLLLVLPFANHTGQPSLNWIGTGAADILNRRLDAADFLTITRDDRIYALEHMGLPPDFQPTIATTIRIAQLLDADYVIVGSYTETGNQLAVSAQILNLHQLTLSPPIQEQAGLDHMLNTLNHLAWDVAKKLDPSYSVAEQTFLVADPTLRPGGFENYIRGLLATTPDSSIKHLTAAVQLCPGFTPARLELGKAYFANQDYADAALTLGKMPSDAPGALEADFYRGLALLYTSKYLQAEDAFAFVATQLPLPEVVNNEGVAASRRGRDGYAFFERAVTADPRDADYHFNLALALYKKHNIPGAIHEIEAELKLAPNDIEAQSFEGALKRLPTTGSAAATAAIPADELPIERIKRAYNETEFHQAAFEMEQIQDARLAMLPAKERAAKLVTAGDQYLHRGLILEAEREYQSAIQANPSSALAHAGLAQVREHSFDLKDARAEAQKSLALAPNVPAYLVLARIDLKAKQTAAAQNEVNAALLLEPKNAAAQAMRQTVESAVLKGDKAP